MGVDQNFPVPADDQETRVINEGDLQRRALSRPGRARCGNSCDEREKQKNRGSDAQSFDIDLFTSLFSRES
jgi:hypothetical protein